MQQEQEQPPPPEMVEPENSELFSPSILKLAKSYELGQPQQEYLASFPLDPHGRAFSLTITIWLCVLPITFFIVFLIEHFPMQPLWIISWIATAVLLTLFIWVVAFLRRYHRKKTHYQRVYVCTSGLLCQRSHAIDAIYWHHIETVKYDALGNCQLHRDDGAVFSFSTPLQQLGELCDCIEQAITPPHLSRLLTTYRDGLPIIFGPLRLNQQGIGLTQKNVIFFAWDKIKGIERRFDSFMLKLPNDRWIGLPLTTHEIPNIHLAHALIGTILQEAEQVTQKLPDARKPGEQKSQETRAQAGASPAPTPDVILTNIMGYPITSATSDRLSVIVYEQGFLYLNKADRKLDIVRWDQITQVVRRAYKSNKLIEYSIEVSCNNATMFVFPRTQPLIAWTGLYVEQKAAEWALPALLTQYDANETTAFGKLTINQAGITYNKRSLPWSEVYHMSILQPYRDYIGIKQRGYNQEWQSIAISRIPDVYLLKLLVDYILSTHPAFKS